MSELFEMFISFFKIGLFTFGGGYAMIPMIQKEVVDNKKWITQEEMMQYFSLSQCTPGVIAVNTATFVGAKKKGAIGAIFTTLGVITPSIVIMTILAFILTKVSHIPVINHAFAGIRPAVASLILMSFIKILKSSVKNHLQIIVCIFSFILVAFFNISPVFIVIIGIAYGLLIMRERGENL